MTTPIASGQVYQINALLVYSLSAAAGGITLGVAFPAARRATFHVVASLTAGQATAPAGFFSVYNLGGSVNAADIATIISGTTVPRMIQINGALVCSGSGNLIFYAKSEVAGDTTKILENSSILAFPCGTVAGL